MFAALDVITTDAGELQMLDRWAVIAARMTAGKPVSGLAAPDEQPPGTTVHNRVGALALTERHAYERHLDACPCCRTNIRRLAGLPGLLAGVREQAWAGTAGVVGSFGTPCI